MGYVFDALSRADDNGNGRPASAGQPAPPPSAGETPPENLPFSLSGSGADGPGGNAGRADVSPDVDDRIVGLTDPTSPMAEEYRSIRTGLLAKWQHRRHIVHTITSATPQEGKTITSLNLGLIFAELHNRKTIVVEGDLRLPQFETLLGLPPSGGLVEVLAEQGDLTRNIQEVGDNRLHVLCAGRPVQDQAVQLLSSSATTSLLQHLKREYDHVIVDTPPVVELADAGILGALSDEVLMVVRMCRTPEPLVQQAIRTLAGYNAPVASLIATDQARHRSQYYSYHYGYRRHYRQYGKAA